MTAAIEVASLFGVLSLEDRATGTLRGFDTQMQSVEQRISRFGGQIAGVGAGLVAMTAPLVGFAAAGMRVASDFENSMAEISARAGVVGEDLQRISDFALQMGADSSYSANQAADAFLQLLTSGQTAEQAIATLPAVLDAAAASGEDLGRTADTVTDILAAFGLQVEDAQMVVDAMAKAAGASSADMASLGQGFGNVGPLARQFGISVEQTAAILAVFAENGIKGAEAGTQLKSMLTNMTRQTDTVANAWVRLGTSMYDATGQVRPIGDVLQDIRRGLDGMTQEQRIQTIQDLAGAFGQMGLAALTAGDPLSDMLTLMGGSASAADVAAARMNTFAGRMETLRGAVETLQIRALKPLMENLKPLVERATEIVNHISDWVAANPQLAATILQVAGAVAGLGTGMVALGTVIKLAAPVIGLLTSPFALIAAGVAATVAGLGVFATVLGVDVLGGIEALGRGIGIFIQDVQDAGIGEALLRAFGLSGAEGESWIEGVLVGFGMAREQAEQIIEDISGFVESFVRGLPSYLSLIPFYAQYYFGMVWSRVQPVLQPILDWFTGDGDDSLSGVIRQVPGWVDENIVAPLRGIWIIVQPFVQPIVDWLNNDLEPTIANVAVWVQDNIVTPLQSAWSVIQPFVQPLIDFLSSIFNQAADTWEMLRRIGGGAPQRALPGEMSPGVAAPSYYQYQLPGGVGTKHPSSNPGGFPPLADPYGNILQYSPGMASLPFQMRDSGGRGEAGMPYLIGAGAQPEWFIPDSAGTFYPNADRLGGKTVHIQPGAVVINTQGGDPEAIAAAVYGVLEDLENR